MLSSRPADVQFHPSKTPGRMKGRGENAVRGPMTAQAKGKEAAARTPFHPTTLHPQKLFKNGSTAQSQLKPTIVTTRNATRPLVDKTPFPNRTGGQQFQTPLPQGSKFAGLSFLEPGTLLQFDKTPDALLRPSSTRKHVRPPRSASKSFETPVNNGNHWDVSDLSIVMPEAQAPEAIVEDDYDEIEYMPPNNLDLPYEPPFDFELPDYTEVGKTLFKLAHLPPYDDRPVPEMDFPVEQIEMVPWDMLELPELGPDEDEPFYEAKLAAKAVPKIPGQLSTLAKGNKAPAVAPRRIPPLKSAAAARTPSTTSISRATASRMPRTGTASSSTTSTLRPTTLKRADTVASITKASVSTLKPTAAFRTPGARSGTSIANSATTTARNKPLVSAIPPRPATSTSTRIRTTPNITGTVPIRRPMTSAATYKSSTTGTGPRLPGNKLGPASTRKPIAVQEAIIVRGDFDFDDDFQFDV